MQNMFCNGSASWNICRKPPQGRTSEGQLACIIKSGHQIVVQRGGTRHGSLCSGRQKREGDGRCDLLQIVGKGLEMLDSHPPQDVLNVVVRSVQVHSTTGTQAGRRVAKLCRDLQGLQVERD